VKKRHGRLITVLVSAGVVLLVGGYLFFSKADNSYAEERYAQAEEALWRGDLLEARNKFYEMYGCKDAAERAEKVNGMYLRTAQVGDDLFFGRYGYATYAKWLVLDVKDKQVLLLLDGIYKQSPFSPNDLNYFRACEDGAGYSVGSRLVEKGNATVSTGEFYWSSFLDFYPDEYHRIVDTNIFILSKEEIERYLPDPKDRALRIGNTPSVWYLRSFRDGIDGEGNFIELDNTLSPKPVRPAIWIDIS